MNGKWLLAACIAIIGASMVVTDVEARRLGGARSLGVQRNVAKPPPAATPAKPAQQQAAAAPQQGAAAAPASGLSRWMPMLGGLAIGGLLGALFAGNGLGGLLLMVLLGVAAFMIFRMLARRGQQEGSRSAQFAGMTERVQVPQGAPAPARHAAASALAVQAQDGLPAGFDAAGFLRGAKMNFVKLQLANDAGNLEEIRDLTTAEMFDALAGDLAGRSGAQHTDVDGLEAELLELSTEGANHWASVRFSGTVREAPGAPAEPFSEVWSLAKPADGSSGWLLAGIQQTQ